MYFGVLVMMDFVRDFVNFECSLGGVAGVGKKLEVAEKSNSRGNVLINK